MKRWRKLLDARKHSEDEDTAAIPKAGPMEEDSDETGCSSAGESNC